MSVQIFQPYFEELDQKTASFFATEHKDDYLADMADNHLNLIHEAFADIDTLIQFEDLVASSESLTNTDLSLIAMSINRIDSKYKNLMNLNVVITESHSDNERITITQEALSGGGMALVAGVIAAIIAFIAWIFGKKNDSNTTAAETAKKTITESEDHAKEIKYWKDQVDRAREIGATALKNANDNSNQDRNTHIGQKNELRDEIAKLKRKINELESTNGFSEQRLKTVEKEKETLQKSLELANSRYRELDKEKNAKIKEYRSAPVFSQLVTQNTFATTFIPLYFRENKLSTSRSFETLANNARGISSDSLQLILQLTNASIRSIEGYLYLLTGPKAFNFKSLSKNPDVTGTNLKIYDSRDEKSGKIVHLDTKDSYINISETISEIGKVIRSDFDLVYGREFNIEQGEFKIRGGNVSIKSIRLMPVINFSPASKPSELKFKDVTIDELDIDSIIELNKICKEWIEDKETCSFYTFNTGRVTNAVTSLKNLIKKIEGIEKSFNSKTVYGELTPAESKYNHRILLTLLGMANKNLHVAVVLNDILTRYALNSTLFVKQLLGQFKEKK